MVQNNISFHQVEKPEFCNLLHYLLACSSSYIALSYSMPTSGNTVRQWILNYFYTSKSFTYDTLIPKNHMVHFSFDLWSSPNNRAFLGIVGHWVDTTGTLHSGLLGMKRFHGPHTGENQAVHFLDVIKDWNLFDNIGYFVLDNASNNDTAMASISENFHSLGKNFPFISHHLHCFGHVINLVVKAFLWGKELNAFEKDLLTQEMQEMEIRNLMAWRKKGPMGKLHNICIWITRNPQ